MDCENCTISSAYYPSTDCSDNCSDCVLIVSPDCEMLWALPTADRVCPIMTHEPCDVAVNTVDTFSMVCILVCYDMELVVCESRSGMKSVQFVDCKRHCGDCNRISAQLREGGNAWLVGCERLGGWDVNEP